MLLTLVRVLIVLVCKLFTAGMTFPFRGIPVLVSEMLVVVFLVAKQAPVLL